MTAIRFIVNSSVPVRAKDIPCTRRRSATLVMQNGAEMPTAARRGAEC
jgi:hypothetical protein